MTNRVDATLIKVLNKRYGNETANLVADTPLFDLGTSRFVDVHKRPEYAASHAHSGEIRMPFSTVATHSALSVDGLGIPSGDGKLHVSTIIVAPDGDERYFEWARESGWEIEDPDGDSYLLLLWAWDTYKADSAEFILAWMSREWERGPLFTLIGGDGATVTKARHDGPGSVAQAVVSEMMDAVIADIFTLDRSSRKHHLALSQRPPGKRAAKTAKFKPWAREDTPHIIFLDPGCKTDVNGNEIRSACEGERVITAHPRRAHERVLRSPKWGKRQGDTVWVKQAWVGPQEWAHKGVQYRIVDLH